MVPRSSEAMLEERRGGDSEEQDTAIVLCRESARRVVPMGEDQLGRLTAFVQFFGPWTSEELGRIFHGLSGGGGGGLLSDLVRRAEKMPLAFEAPWPSPRTIRRRLVKGRDCARDYYSCSFWGGGQCTSTVSFPDNETRDESRGVLCVQRACGEVFEMREELEQCCKCQSRPADVHRW